MTQRLGSTVRLGDVVVLRTKRDLGDYPETGNHKVLNLENIEEGTGRTIGDRMAQSTSRSRADGVTFLPRDVLFGRLRPYLRKYYMPDHGGICSGEFWVMRADAQRLLPAFLYNVIQTDIFIRVANRTSGSRMPRADWGVVREFRFALPSMETQRRIVELLSTWDDGMHRIRALRFAKARQKLGVIQVLFGRDGNWRKCQLGDIAGIIISNVDKKSRHGECAVRLCNYMDVYSNNTIDPTMDLMSATATRAQIEKHRLAVDDVLITKDSEDPTDIAVPALVQATAPDLVCGYHLAIIRSGPDVDGSFLKTYFDLRQTRAYFGARANGATRFGLTKGEISRAVIGVPPLEEQRAITAALWTWDESIAKLEAQEAAIRRQKRGLLNELLGARKPVGDTKPVGSSP